MGLMLGAEGAESGRAAFFIVVQLITAVLSTFALAGVVHLILQGRKEELPPPEAPAPQTKVERLTTFDHSFREISRQLVELKNELAAIRNTVEAIEMELSQEEGAGFSPLGVQETRPGTSQRLGRALSVSVEPTPDPSTALRSSVERYCMGEIGVEALLEAARQAGKPWGTGRGKAYGAGRAAEIAVEWEQLKNLPLLVIEKDDSPSGFPSYWILVNGFRKFSEYLVVAFREPEPMGGDLPCRTRVPGEGLRISDDRIRIEKIGEVASG
jgi:hypothetical protein